MRCPAAAARASNLGPYGLRRAVHAVVLYLSCSVNGKLLLGWTRNTRILGAPALGMAMVATSFAGGGRPAYCGISHPVPVPSGETMLLVKTVL